MREDRETALAHVNALFTVAHDGLFKAIETIEPAQAANAQEKARDLSLGLIADPSIGIREYYRRAQVVAEKLKAGDSIAEALEAARPGDSEGG